MAIAWQTEAIELLRVLINDLSDTPTYTDSHLTRLLIVAAYQVIQEVDFTQEFVVDIEEQDISPDPSATATKDDVLINLMCIKAACILDRGKAGIAAGKAISGKDMNAVQFDLTGVATSTLALLKQGWCAVYKEAIYDYVSGTGNLGKVVMGPFRTYLR